MKLTKIEIVSAFGFVVGIAGLILSVYFYQAQKRFKGLAFIVDPKRTLVVSPGHLPSPHVTLLDKEGKHVMNDVYSTEMYVWNSGTETILGQDIIVPLKVVIPPEVRLLDVRTTNVSRQQVTQAAAAVQSGGEQIIGVAITFRVLEPTEGIRFSVLCEGGKDVSFDFSGAVTGIRQLTDLKQIEDQQRWIAPWKAYVPLFIIISFVAILGAAVIVAGLIWGAISKRWFPKVGERIASGVAVAFFCIVVAVPLWVLGKAAVEPWLHSKAIVREKIRDYVPKSLKGN